MTFLNINIKTPNGDNFPAQLPLAEILGNLPNYIDEKFRQQLEMTNVVYLGFNYDMKKYSAYIIEAQKK